MTPSIHAGLTRRTVLRHSLMAGAAAAGTIALGLPQAAAADLKVTYGFPKPNAEMRRRIHWKRWQERRRQMAFRHEMRRETMESRRDERWSRRLVRSFTSLFD